MLIPTEVKQIEWYINGVQIVPNDIKYGVKYIPEKGLCSLIINDINQKDVGDYSCKIITNVGEHKSTCTLKIEQGRNYQKYI